MRQEPIVVALAHEVEHMSEEGREALKELVVAARKRFKEEFGLVPLADVRLETLGRYTKNSRLEAGQSIREFTKAVGFSHHNKLVNLERGNPPSVETLQLICRHLKLRPCMILDMGCDQHA